MLRGRAAERTSRPNPRLSAVAILLLASWLPGIRASHQPVTSSLDCHVVGVSAGECCSVLCQIVPDTSRRGSCQDLHCVVMRSPKSCPLRTTSMNWCTNPRAVQESSPPALNARKNSGPGR
jgi:hypothetical protein